jgi:hypothetical protein
MRRIKRKAQSITPKKLHKLIIILLSSIFFVFILFYIYSSKLTEINCTSQFGECPQVLMGKLNNFKGKKIGYAYVKAKRLLAGESGLESFNLFYIPFTKLKVSLVEIKPYYAIKDSTSGLIELIDKNGWVVAITDNSDLSFIISNVKTDRGLQIPEGQLFALQLLNDISRVNKIEKAELNDDSLVIELQDDLNVIFPLEGDRQVLIGSLILIYNDLKSGTDTKLNTLGKKIDTIDLRFKNPILK